MVRLRKKKKKRKKERQNSFLSYEIEYISDFGLNTS